MRSRKCVMIGIAMQDCDARAGESFAMTMCHSQYKIGICFYHFFQWLFWGK